MWIVGQSRTLSGCRRQADRLPYKIRHFRLLVRPRSARCAADLFIRVIRAIRGLIVLWSKRLNDFFEARIAAERVPEGQQF
jgi:hypothetical protein